ncbi:MAG TPA: SMI1/KNR4 family protein [Isosphaeraceae bacterium]
MIEASIEAVEEKLGHPLPTGYRRFLQDCSPEDWGDFPVPLYSPDLVIKRNLAIRSNPDRYLVRVKDASGVWRLFDRPWPADWIVIGDNGGGDCWFVHRDEAEPGLWFWSHESHEAAADDRYGSFPTALALTPRRTDREARSGSGPGPERTTHPLLGDLDWNPGDGQRSWSGTGRTSGGDPVPFRILVPAYVTATGAELAAILESAAPVVARAAAAAPEVFEAALPDFLRLQHDSVERDPKRPKLTANQLRALLTGPTINAHCEPGGLQLSYLYRGGEPFGWDMIDVAVNTELEYQGLQIF